ncbi:MAG: hypothetical protein Q7U47_03765 [Paludibacter sp.]|nr:hypothetical protein [Paludibacter sp.]
MMSFPVPFLVIRAVPSIEPVPLNVYCVVFSTKMEEGETLSFIRTDFHNASSLKSTESFDVKVLGSLSKAQFVVFPLSHFASNVG